MREKAGPGWTRLCSARQRSTGLFRGVPVRFFQSRGRYVAVEIGRGCCRGKKSIDDECVNEARIEAIGRFGIDGIAKKALKSGTGMIG